MIESRLISFLGRFLILYELMMIESKVLKTLQIVFRFSCIFTRHENSYFLFKTNFDNFFAVFVSVLPEFDVYLLQDFINSPSISCKNKFFALLQSTEYWDQEEMANLIVLHQTTEKDTELIYVHPQPYFPNISCNSSSSGSSVSASNSHNNGRRLSKIHLQTEFEISMKQILLMPRDEASLLCDNDKEALLRRISGSVEEVKAQLRLFLQLKLFSPLEDSPDALKIRKLRSERAVQQWLDKERASCMKEAVERTMQKSSEPLTPYKKCYLEFLMTPDNGAKAVLDMLTDLMNIYQN